MKIERDKSLKGRKAFAVGGPGGGMMGGSGSGGSSRTAASSSTKSTSTGARGPTGPSGQARSSPAGNAGGAPGSSTRSSSGGGNVGAGGSNNSAGPRSGVSGTVSPTSGSKISSGPGPSPSGGNVSTPRGDLGVAGVPGGVARAGGALASAGPRTPASPMGGQNSSFSTPQAAKNFNNQVAARTSVGLPASGSFPSPQQVRQDAINRANGTTPATPRSYDPLSSFQTPRQPAQQPQQPQQSYNPLSSVQPQRQPVQQAYNPLSSVKTPPRVDVVAPGKVDFGNVQVSGGLTLAQDTAPRPQSFSQVTSTPGQTTVTPGVPNYGFSAPVFGSTPKVNAPVTGALRMAEVTPTGPASPMANYDSAAIAENAQKMAQYQQQKQAVTGAINRGATLAGGWPGQSAIPPNDAVYTPAQASVPMDPSVPGRNAVAPIDLRKSAQPVAQDPSIAGRLAEAQRPGPVAQDPSIAGRLAEAQQPKAPPTGPYTNMNLRGVTGPMGEPVSQPATYGTNYQTAQMARAMYPDVANKYDQTRLTQALDRFTQAMPGEAGVSRYGTDALNDIGRVGLNQIVGGFTPEQMLSNMDTTGIRKGTAKFAQPGPNSMGMTDNWADPVSGKAYQTLSANALREALMQQGVSPQALNASNFVAAGTKMVKGVNKVGAPINGTQFGSDPTWGTRIADRNLGAMTAFDSNMIDKPSPVPASAREPGNVAPQAPVDPSSDANPPSQQEPRVKQGKVEKGVWNTIGAVAGAINPFAGAVVKGGQFLRNQDIKNINAMTDEEFAAYEARIATERQANIKGAGTGGGRRGGGDSSTSAQSNSTGSNVAFDSAPSAQAPADPATIPPPAAVTPEAARYLSLNFDPYTYGFGGERAFYSNNALA